MKLSYLYSISVLIGSALPTPVEPGGGFRPSAATGSVISDARIREFITKVRSGEILINNDDVLRYWNEQPSEASQGTLDVNSLLSEASHIKIVDVEEGQKDEYKGISRITLKGQHVQYKLWLGKEDFASEGGREKPSDLYQIRTPGTYLPDDGFTSNTLNGAFRFSDQFQIQLTQSGLNKICSYTIAIQNHARANGISIHGLGAAGRTSWAYTLNFDPKEFRPAKQLSGRKDTDTIVQRRSDVSSQLSSLGLQGSSILPIASTAAFVQSTLTYYAKLQANITVAVLPFVESILASNNTLLHTLALPLYGMASPTTLVTSSPFAPGLMAPHFDSFSGTQAQLKAAGNYSSTQLQGMDNAVGWLRAELDSRWDEAEKVVNATGELLVMRNIQLYLGLLELKSKGSGVFPESYYQAQKDKKLEAILERLKRNGTV